ncbi:hypothetical protein H9Q69_012290 [Fusarium xylarioides]|uniref:Uncharacterized protein n=1 Tax=Fusarium xylarioides TaxID=221167 RepID=A0A9P7ID66_9HYPO|nr:hypothetical protein H9Q72_013756 [Fusarium xylarioides]KAG5788642.1 hypothetical protein H9Q69_012290 [Fusarium xylarioides]KAG5801945.1 hypothetical protein H9Q71_013468 [Fusarium xylarioides]KAG5812042.1 hypothetical protein H9Q74_013298 [Fusarium xylarioides]
MFSLVAARSRQFTSYLMFTEDYVQRTLFISSRGLSRAGLVVLAFSLLNVVFSLYGTLLWALDSPGYIFRATNATVSDYQSQRNSDPPYILQISLDKGQLTATTKKLPQIIGAELFNPGLNYTLTGKVSNSHGLPTTIAPTRVDDVGARIWLDDDGFSVSPDTNSMIPYSDTLNVTYFSTCVRFTQGVAVWNCTFDNADAQTLLDKQQTGLPEIHWSDSTDKVLDSRYIRPNRMDNIWVSVGVGGGSALMNQVFTVTKKRKRHTFSQLTLKVTMVTNPGVPFARDEVADIVRRTWSYNETEQKNPLVGRIIQGMMSAQDENASYEFGFNAPENDNKTALQSQWGFLTAEVNGTAQYSLLSITTTNITLIRSEDLTKAPVPFEECKRSNFQNEAFGGRVVQTDCAGSSPARGKPSFFGQVDTAAVMITRGLGATRSNISAVSLDNDVLNWLRENVETIESLLVARAYSSSIDPALVQISVDKLMVAMSRLQLALSCFALFLALIGWLGLMILADAHWASTLFANLIHTTSEPSKTKPGYITRAPNLSLVPAGQKRMLAVDGRVVTVADSTSFPMQPMGSPEHYPNEVKGHAYTGAFPVAYHDPNAGRQALLSGYEQGLPNR